MCLSFLSLSRRPDGGTRQVWWSSALRLGSGNRRQWDQTGACQWSLGSREERGQRRMTRRDWRGVRASRPNSAVQGGCTGSQRAQRPGLGSLKLCTFPSLYSDALWGVCAQLAFPRRHGRSRRILNSFDCPLERLAE